TSPSATPAIPNATFCGPGNPERQLLRKIWRFCRIAQRSADGAPRDRAFGCAREGDRTLSAARPSVRWPWMRRNGGSALGEHAVRTQESRAVTKINGKGFPSGGDVCHADAEAFTQRRKIDAKELE